MRERLEKLEAIYSEKIRVQTDLIVGPEVEGIATLHLTGMWEFKVQGSFFRKQYLRFRIN